MTQDPKENRQAGAAVCSSAAESGAVAHGSQREQVHYEADPDQLVRARFTKAPAGPMPPDEQSHALDEEGRAFSDAPPKQDVAVGPGEESVWDARAEEGDEGTGGLPTGR
jgi:hypothetical protein